MQAHCPKCGKFAAEVSRTGLYEDRGRWFWRRRYLCEWSNFYCKRCSHKFEKPTEERLR